MRKVVALPWLFADLGGLYGFFAAITIFVLGRYQSGAFILHQLYKLYELPIEMNPAQKFKYM